jgi:hypothetical protein
VIIQAQDGKQDIGHVKLGNPMMTMQDLKLYLINAGTFTISMTQIDTVLKISLLVISIGYTAQRWYYLRQENKNKDNG